MATTEEIKNEFKDAKEMLAEAKGKLETFENDNDDGKWLKTLRSKARTGKLSDDKRDEKKRLEEEKTMLDQAVETRTKEMEEWGKGYVSSPLSQVTTLLGT